MKKIAMMIVLLTMTACTMSGEVYNEEEDRANHEAYLESIYTKYDPEYIDDCLAYEELVCEFE